MRELGDRLREERQRLKLIQPQLAGVGDVAVQAQSLYESGKRIPRADYLARISRVGVDVRYVLTGERNGAALLSPYLHEEGASFDHEVEIPLRPPLSAGEEELVRQIRGLEPEDQAAFARLIGSLSRAG